MSSPIPLRPPLVHFTAARPRSDQDARDWTAVAEQLTLCGRRIDELVNGPDDVLRDDAHIDELLRIAARHERDGERWQICESCSDAVVGLSSQPRLIT